MADQTRNTLGLMIKERKKRGHIVWFGRWKICQRMYHFLSQTFIAVSMAIRERIAKLKRSFFSEDEHIYSGKRKRMYIQTTKKVGCTAKLFIRYIRRFDKFSIEKGASKVRKQIIMDTLKAALQKNEAESSEIIHINLPLETAHQHHKISSESGYTRNNHPLVKKKIQEYVSLGITSVPFLKKVFRQLVNTELSASDCVLPKSHDQCYFSSSHTIQNHVHLSLVVLDQLNLGLY